MIERSGEKVRSIDSGQTLILIMVVVSIMMLFLTGLAGWSMMNLRAVNRSRQAEQAFMIAEAGTEYYRWHLAHAPTDFQDGTGEAGPYVHEYRDKDGNLIGTFTLDITAPEEGSTLVLVKSTGVLAAAPNVRRAVEVRLAKPSWAKFAVVANDNMRFGEGTEVFGQLHSNEGIRFDGLTHNLVTSARTTYDDPDHGGGEEFAVHTHDWPTDPLPPAEVPSRTDVFETGRKFPVPAVDFDGVTADLAEIKTLAQDDGIYLAPSGFNGYHITLNTNDTLDLYRVTSVYSPPWGCSNVGEEDYWGTWSIQQEDLIENRNLPNNGLIFVEDHVWVDGQIDGARVTIAAGRFPQNPSTYRHITVNDDLTYTNYDGQDVIGLIAQGNFNVGLRSEDDLHIDAAILAQEGRAGRHYYRGPWWWQERCAPYHERERLTLYGMIGTNNRYGFAWTDGTGYDERNLNYDANLLYAPPPKFPLTSEQYEVVSWREVTP